MGSMRAMAKMKLALGGNPTSYGSKCMWFDKQHKLEKAVRYCA